MPRSKSMDVCPMGMMSVGGKLKTQIIYHLLHSTRRFGELQRLLPDASRQMLTMQLRQLEQMGMLHRQVYDQMPPKVEYSLTEMGQSLEPFLQGTFSWMQQYCEQKNIEQPWTNEPESINKHKKFIRNKIASNA